MTKYVYDFAEGGRELADLLGGKGANLAEMSHLGLPVPPGFTITTEACQAYLASGVEPDGLAAEVEAHLQTLEAAMGRRLGDRQDPLLVSVRSGAKFSMPGMMDTVLNIGLGHESVEGLAAQSGDRRFAWDSFRRLIQMFGKTVLGVPGELFEDALARAKEAKGARTDLDLDAAELQSLVGEFERIVAETSGRPFPTDAREQVRLATRAVFESWNGERAVLYRRAERIPNDLGTAVSVVAMVFGNLGPDSGTGVAFTRDPGSGQQGVYGDYLANAQGEDVVARHPQPGAAGGLGRHRSGFVRRADVGHEGSGRALPRPLRHRIHDRARQAVDAADPGRQADRRRRVPDRDPAGGSGPDRSGRGAAPGQR